MSKERVASPKTEAPPNAPQVRVLLVDDHPAIREVLRLRIARESDLVVCGEAADLVDALQVADATNPDVAIIDIALKTASGIDLIKRLKLKHGSIRMIVWSMYSDEFFAERALRAGARGYISKEKTSDEIIAAIRQVAAGRLYVNAEISEKLLGHLVGLGAQTPDGPDFGNLSDRELDVFRLIGQGLKTAEIAARLHLSINTIETYRDRIRAKLDISDGASLVYRAIQWVHDTR